MRIHFASDLHLEYLNKRFPDYIRVDRLYAPFADLLILAGDIHVGTQMVDKFGQWPHPVLYVPGNHEFYDTAIDVHLAKIKAAAEGTAMVVLARDEYVTQGVRFLGCTLWTDYLLMGSGGRQLAAMLACEARIADHRKIMGVKKMGQGFSAQQAYELHLEERAWLESKLNEPFNGKTVVITHHAPSRGSVHPRFRGDPCNSAFVSDLEGLVEKADFWIHGHVHDTFDYKVGNCRVMTNPGSYATTLGKVKAPEDLEWENPYFDPQKLFEL
ncbi:MAG: metallophosphoesterase [Burkholderiaceae bacterium]